MTENALRNSTVSQIIAEQGFFAEEYVSHCPMLEMHYHVFFELYYVIRGQREYFIGDRFFRAEEGDVVVVPPDLLHRTDGGTASRILLHFSEDFLKIHFSETLFSTFEVLKGASVLHPAPEDEQRVGRLFTRIHSAYLRDVRGETPPEKDGELVFALGELLFLLSGKSTTPKGSPIVNDRLAETVKFINDNFATIRTIDEIAERFYFSKYHLCHLFRESLGISIISYLNMVKIRAACALMQNEDLRLTDVAERCGFNSSAYFCKVFRDEEGVSPSDYRRHLFIESK